MERGFIPARISKLLRVDRRCMLHLQRGLLEYEKSKDGELLRLAFIGNDARMEWVSQCVTSAPSSYDRIIFLLHICGLNLIASATFTSSALVAIVISKLSILSLPDARSTFKWRMLAVRADHLTCASTG